MSYMLHKSLLTAAFAMFTLSVCAQEKGTLKKKPISQPLVKHIYTADHSAHVFNGRFYIYPSHDIEASVKENDNGDHFDMRDYHILSMDSTGGKVTDHGVALDKKDIPWAGRQLWAPDAAYKNGTYYLYFPIKDKQDIFRIGVATAKTPMGPFKAEKEPIKGSYSIDPSVCKDTDGSYYLYFGGIWGGQLQHWTGNQYNPNAKLKNKNERAILPRIAKLSADMKSFTEEARNIQIVDEPGKTFLESNNDKRFFEAAWMHTYQGNIIFPIQPEIHLISVMLPATTHTGLSPIKEGGESGGRMDQPSFYPGNQRKVVYFLP